MAKQSTWVIIIEFRLIISLNYNKFFTDGEELITETNDYTSHNTNN